MKQAVMILFLLLSSNAFAFDLLSYKWGITEASPSICWALDTPLPASLTVTEDDVKTLITNSIARWESVSTSFVQFTECANPAEVEDSDTIVVTVSDTAAASSGGCASVSSNGFCNSALVILRDALFSSYALAAGYHTTITHEFGHAIGIGHSDRPSVMAYHKRTSEPSSDDWAAVTYLYPNDSVEDYTPYGCASVDNIGPPNSSGRWMALLPLLVAMSMVALRKRRSS